MLNLRCTQKLLQRLKVEPEQDKETSTTKLGDWHANLIYTTPELILFMSEKTLLPVLVAAKPIDTLLPRFRAALREVLTSLKVPEETIAQEESAMTQVRFKKTINRSVLGTMAEFSQMLESYAEDKRSLLELSLSLADTPCSALKKEPPYPDRATAQLLGGSLPNKVSPLSQAKQEASLYTLEVFIVDGPMLKSFVKKNRVIARTIEVLGSQTLEELHYAIFDAFDREDQHLFAFEFNGKGPGDPKANRYSLPPRIKEKAPTDTGRDATTTTLGSLGLTTDSTFGYQLDFGDDWWHQINVLQIGASVPKVKYPRVIAKKGESPPQYADFDEETNDEPRWATIISKEGVKKILIPPSSKKTPKKAPTKPKKK